MRYLAAVLAAAVLSIAPVSGQTRQHAPPLGWGASNVTLTMPSGASFDVMLAIQQASTQVVENSWTSGGTKITVTTPRKETPEGYQEPNSDWVARHKASVDIFKFAFPPDPPQQSPPLGGGGGIGSLPANQTVAIEWPSGSDTVRAIFSPRPYEIPPAFGQRVLMGCNAVKEVFPPY